MNDVQQNVSGLGPIPDAGHFLFWASNEAIELLVAKYRFKTVLDIGSGAGHHAVWLRERGKQVTTICYSASYGFKPDIIGDFLQTEFEEQFDVVCLNETKLTGPVYLDNYWSYQTMLQRNGGAWTAASNKVKLTLVKALGTYLCWVRLTTGRQEVQILNCYLEPWKERFQEERAKRVTDIIKDIIS